MPRANARHDARQVGAHLFAPDVLFLQPAHGRAHGRQQRPSLPGRQPRLEGAPCRRGVGFLALAAAFAILRLALDVRPDREQRRRRVLVQPRQRPVRLVVAAVAVALEEPLEPVEEHRAGQRAAEIGERAVVRLQIPHHHRLVPRDVGQRDEIDRLLCAHRPLAGRELRIHQAVVREPGRVGRLAEEVFAQLHAAHHEDDLQRRGRSPQPPLKRRADLLIRQRRRIDGVESSKDVSNVYLMR